MKYSKADEIIFTYIVNGLVKLNKNPDYIKKLLADNKLCSKKVLKSFDQLTWHLLKIEWKATDGWIESFGNLGSTLQSIINEKEVNNITSNTSSQDKKENLILVQKNKKIPYIEKFQLDKIVLNKDINIEISPNDAATLLKIMGSLQSKLNEIIKSINSIAELMNGETRESYLLDDIANNSKDEGLAFSKNADQVILINIEAIQSKFNEVVRAIRKIEKLLVSTESDYEF